ncbi:hypothetical protein [Micromonospora sp. NPDC092111]|uniref:hypothetical protein n=1 Tax=Micromonospora sp. NPDC092111 TaxID=3364289 RepID=UPI00380E84D0
MESGTRRDAGRSGWGVAWFLWNLPITLAVISLVYVAVTLADQVSSGDGVDVARLVNGYILSVPCYGFMAWLAGSGLIAAVCSTGIRNQILVRLPVAVLPALLAIPASDNSWMAAFFVCSGLGLAVSLRLPGTSGTVDRGTGHGADAFGRGHYRS